MEKARDVEVYVVFATSAVIALPSSCCGRSANQKSRWVLPAEARRALRPPRRKSLPPIYKAACPSCLPPSQTSIDTTKHTTSTTHTSITINSNTSTHPFSITKFQIHQNDWRQIRRKGQRLQERAIVSRIPPCLPVDVLDASFFHLHLSTSDFKGILQSHSSLITNSS
jgi:hypothetical protein